MPSRRDAIRMTPEEYVEFLETQAFGVLGTVGPTGDPHLVTVGFALDGPDAFIVSSFRTAQKVVNVSRHRRASLLVETTTPYSQIRGVLASGPVTVVDDLEQVTSWHERLGARSARLVPDEELPSIDFETVLRKRVLLRIVVERAITWDHRKLGGVY